MGAPKEFFFSYSSGFLEGFSMLFAVTGCPWVGALPGLTLGWAFSLLVLVSAHPISVRRTLGKEEDTAKPPAFPCSDRATEVLLCPQITRED